MLMLYLRDFASNSCAVIGPTGVANHLSFSGVTATNCGIESRMCMNGGTINISPVGYKNLFNTKQMSISFWMTANTAGICMGNEDTSGSNNRGYSIFLYPSVNDLHLSWQDDSGATSCAPVIYGVIKSGDWNHICVVNNNGNVKVYVNGTKVHEETMQTWTKNWSAASTGQLVKCQSGNHIDAVRFYNHALSEDEVLNLYKSPFVIINNPHHILGDWQAPIQAVNVKETPILSLPSEYQQVVYLQASGAQQINTGLKFNMAVDSCEVDFQSTVTSQNGMIFASTEGTSNHFWFYHYADNSCIDLYIKNAGSQIRVGGKAIDTNRHLMTFANKQYKLDGALLGTDSRSLGATDHNVYLFSWGNNYYYQGRIYRCKIWSNGNLVRDFIPCYRKSDSKPGLLDIVNNVFYTNTGSGEFTIGSRVTACPVGSYPMYFNGSNSYIAIPHTNNFKVDKLLTINIWAYKDNWAEFGSRNERLYSCAEAGGWDIWPTSTSASAAIQAELYTSNSYNPCSGPACNTISSGWHMFTQTFNYNTSTHKFYIDGVLQSSKTTTYAYISYNTSNYIFIGCEAQGNTAPYGCYFQGLIADFRMIAGELTATEIANLYNGKGVKMLDNYALNGAPTVIYGNATQQELKKHGLSCRYVVSNVCPMRYIKDTLSGGSTANTGNHWNGIRVYNESGYDLSANATSKLNGTADSTAPLLRNAYDANNWRAGNMEGNGTSYQLIDLGGLCYVNRIEVHHYGEDSRRYLNHKLEYSEDGNTWHTIHDSTIHGTYTEKPISSGAMTFYPVMNKIIFRPDGGVLAKNFLL